MWNIQLIWFNLGRRPISFYWKTYSRLCAAVLSLWA